MKPSICAILGLMLVLGSESGVAQTKKRSENTAPDPTVIWVKLENRDSWDLGQNEELLIQLYGADIDADGVPSIGNPENYIVERPCNPEGGVYAPIPLRPTVTGKYVLAILRANRANPRTSERTLIGWYIKPGTSGPLPQTPTTDSVIDNKGQHDSTNALTVCAKGACIK